MIRIYCSKPPSFFSGNRSGVVIRIISLYLIYTLAQKDKNVSLFQNKIKKEVATE